MDHDTEKTDNMGPNQPEENESVGPLYAESATEQGEAGTTHRWRMISVAGALGVIAFSGIAFVLNHYMDRSITDPSAISSAGQGAPKNVQAGPASDEYQKRLDVANQTNAEQAAASGDSNVLIPPREELIEPKEPEKAKPEDAPPPPPPPPPPQPVQPQENPYGAYVDDELKQIAARMNPGAIRVVSFEDQNAGRNGDRNASRGEPRITPAVARAPARVAYPDGIRTGNVLYAINDLALNSDSPSPATATIIGGELDGARAIGSFERRGEYLVLGFNRIALPDGRVYQIDGVAVDTAIPQASIRSAIDKHYLSRWGSFTAASFLSGFADATALAGNSYLTSVGPLGGATVQNSLDYSLNDQLWIAGGRVADRAASYLERNLYRPPTVTLKPGMDIGVLILAVKDQQAVNQQAVNQQAVGQQAAQPAGSGANAGAEGQQAGGRQ